MKQCVILVFVALVASVLALPAQAQAATHSVILTWIDTQNPVGTTYSAKRATGLCTGSPTFSTLSTGIAVKTYTDTPVAVGNFCYVVTATNSGVESVNSNLAAANVPPFAPTSLTFTITDLLYPELVTEYIVGQWDVEVRD